MALIRAGEVSPDPGHVIVDEPSWAVPTESVEARMGSRAGYQGMGTPRGSNVRLHPVAVQCRVRFSHVDRCGNSP